MLSETMSNIMSVPLSQQGSAAKLGWHQALVNLNIFWRKALTTRANYWFCAGSKLRERREIEAAETMSNALRHMSAPLFRWCITIRP